MELQRILDGIADRDTHYALINRYNHSSPHAGLGFAAGQFWRICEEEFWYFLEILPPLGHTGRSFALSEFTRGNLTESYHQIGDRFYCATIAYEGPNSVREAFAAIANATAADR